MAYVEQIWLLNLINLPFGGFAVLIIFLCLPSNSLSVTKLGWKEQLKHYDLPGTVVLISSIICLILALQWGGPTYPWGNGQIIALFVIAGVLFTVFIGIQMWQRVQATLPMRLLKNRNIWGAVWYGSFVSASMFYRHILFMLSIICLLLTNIVTNIITASYLVPGCQR